MELSLENLRLEIVAYRVKRAINAVWTTNFAV